MSKTGAETQQERYQAGKCCSCKEPRTHGARCFKHWLKEKKKSPIFDRRRSKGMCGTCGQRPPFPTDDETCQECRDGKHLKQPARSKEPKPPRPLFNKPWHQRNKEAGYCMKGGAAHAKPEAGHSLCNVCRAEKTRRYSARKQQGLCRDCDNRVTSGRYCDECKEQQKQKRIDNIRRGKCADCGKRPPRPGKKACERCAEKNKITNRRRVARFKREVLAHYGDVLQCFCCHEGNPDLLELDHIEGDGAAHRRKIGGKNSIGSGVFYYWLKKNGFPPGLQLSCATCNRAKHRHGHCPHQDLPPELLAQLREANAAIAHHLCEEATREETHSHDPAGR